MIVKLSDFGLATTEKFSADVDCGSAPYMSYGAFTVALRCAACFLVQTDNHRRNRVPQSRRSDLRYAASWYVWFLTFRFHVAFSLLLLSFVIFLVPFYSFVLLPVGVHMHLLRMCERADMRTHGFHFAPQS